MTATYNAVFLSYASQDAEAARRICDALRGAGVEVWFDADGGLEHGDEWDAKIRRQIKECVLFIPVISAHTQAREEGYFRIEWELAAQRAMGIASGVPFILPVVIDATREPDALVPDRFRSVQWTRLPRGEVPPDVLQRFLKLWSHRTGVLAHQAARSTPPARSESVGSPERIPAARSRAPLIAGGVLVLAGLAALALWQPWRPRPAAIAAGAPGAAVANKVIPPASHQSENSFPRSPELKRAWDIFLNAVNATTEDFALAEDIVKNVAARRPADAEPVIVYAWLNDAYLNRGFDLSEERFVLGRRYAERAVQLAPDEPEALAALGQFLSFRGADLARAEQLLRRAIELKPREPRFYRALAYNVVRPTRPDEALQIAEQAAQLFPNDALVLYELGLHYRDAGRIDDMERAFDRTLTLAPIGAAMIWKSWITGWVHGDVPGMKRWLNQIPGAVRLTDRALIVRYQYARLTAEPAEVADALQALLAFPGATLRDFYYTGPKATLIGDLYAAQGKPELARGQFELALNQLAPEKAVAPSDGNLLRAEIWSLLGLNRRAEAVADLRLVAGLSSPDTRARFVAWWFNAAPAALLAGERELALQQIKSLAGRAATRNQLRVALRIDPRMAPFRDDPEIAALLAEPAAETVAVPPPAKSVAVLAFSNLSDDKANEYFSDGISEELLNVLGRVPGLRVAARNSAFYFKNKNAPAQEIGEKLRVANLIDGSVQKLGSRVRVVVRLSHADTGEQVWSEHYDREFKDAFALEDEIARDIAQKFQLALGGGSASRHEVAPEAHRLYLLGRFHLSQNTAVGRASAADCFNQAIQLDSAYALAYCGLADYYGFVGGDEMSGVEAWPREKELAQKALALDPTLAEAHFSLGLAQADAFAWDEGMTSMKRAIDLNPNYALAHDQYAWCLSCFGKHDAALAENAKALELDPLSGLVNLDRGYFLYYAGRYDDAIAQARKTLELESNHAYASTQIGWCRLRKGDLAGAVAEFRKTESLVDSPWWCGSLGYALGMAGNRSDAEQVLRGIEELAKRRYVSPGARVPTLLGLGRKDEALVCLEKACDAQDGICWWLKVDPLFDGIRNEARFRALLKKVGFEP